MVLMVAVANRPHITERYFAVVEHKITNKKLSTTRVSSIERHRAHISPWEANLCFYFLLLLRNTLSLEAIGNAVIFLKSRVDRSTRFCVI